MQATILLLPALAVLCYGAALPQILVSTGSVAPLPEPTTYTFTIPCAAAAVDCAPRTVVLVGGDGDDGSRTILPRDSQATHAAGNARQVLGSPTRTVIVSPTPPWSYPGWPWWPTGVPTVPVEKREPQVLGSPTRTVLVSPTPTPTPTWSFPGWPWWPTPLPSFTVPLDRREPQVLGSPTRTVLESPTPEPTVSTVTVTITTTYYPSSASTTEPITSIPWWPWPYPFTTRSLTTDPAPTTSTVTPLTVPIGKRNPQALGSPTRSVPVHPKTPTPTHTTKKKTTTTAKHTTTSSAGYYEKRQELGSVTGSIDWYTGGNSGLTATVTLVGPDKRQELGIPTGSVIWWEEDAEPTDRVLEPPKRREERRRNRIQLK